jgi:hypothetical protein
MEQLSSPYDCAAALGRERMARVDDNACAGSVGAWF